MDAMKSFLAYLETDTNKLNKDQNKLVWVPTKKKWKAGIILTASKAGKFIKYLLESLLIQYYQKVICHLFIADSL